VPQDKLAEHAREMEDLARAARINENDPDSDVLDPARLPKQLQKLLGDMHANHAAEKKQMQRVVDDKARHATDEAQKARALYKG
jgi:hypothetical protein